MSPDSHAPRTMGPFPDHVKPCHRVTCTPDAPLSACMGAITVTPVFWRHPPGHGNSNLTSGAIETYSFSFLLSTLHKTTCLPRSPNFHDLHLRIYVEFIGNQVS